MTGDPYGPWFGHTFVVFDVETTGLEASEDRVVELGAARFENGALVKRWGSLVNPGTPIPEEATNIHGISTADVAEAPPFIGALGEIIGLARNAHPVAYNASFDKRFWFHEIARTGLTELHAIPMFDERVRWLDPLVWMRKRNGIWGNNKLTACCERMGIDIGQAHRATDDAVATGNVMLSMQRDIPGVTLTEVLRRQSIFDARQTDERRAWFHKKGLPFR